LIGTGRGEGSGTSRVEVWRGDMVESIHRVSLAVVDSAGAMRRWSGATDIAVYARSAVKPFQALPLVEDGVLDRLAFSEEELALACASHSGEPVHVALAESMLRKAGLTEAALACGPHAPFHGDSARELRRRGRQPGRVHNNCSGKHAGMLALAIAHGWPPEGYHRPDHPVQQRMLQEMVRWCDVPPSDVVLGTDGCGVVTFGLPLRQLALGFARFSAAAAQGEPGPDTVVGSMVRHPRLVGGTDRLCTRVMEVARGRLFVKVGAEGVYCGGAPDARLGFALKVEDGAGRAAEAALVALLRELELLTAAEASELQRFAEPPVRNTRDEVVGAVRARLQLEVPRD
jgi:L-asparaginase II